MAPPREVETLLDTAAPLEARISAANALGAAGDTSALDALAVALDVTSEDLRDASREAARALAGPALFAARLASTTASADARRRAARALRHLKDPATVAALAAGLSDADPGLRRECAHALAVFGAAKAREALEAALSDASSDVRYFAVLALAPLAAARPALESRLAAEADPVVRDELSKALRR